MGFPLGNGGLTFWENHGKSAPLPGRFFAFICVFA